MPFVHRHCNCKSLSDHDCSYTTNGKYAIYRYKPEPEVIAFVTLHSTSYWPPPFLRPSFEYRWKSNRLLLFLIIIIICRSFIVNCLCASASVRLHTEIKERKKIKQRNSPINRNTICRNCNDSPQHIHSKFQCAKRVIRVAATIS